MRTDSKEQQEYFKDNPKKYLEYRKQIENELNQRFKFIIKGSDEANAARKVAYTDMVKHLGDRPELIDKVGASNQSALAICT